MRVQDYGEIGGSYMLGTTRSGSGGTGSPPCKSPPLPPGFPAGENKTGICCSGDLA